jgi:hypothetical protein
VAVVAAELHLAENTSRCIFLQRLRLDRHCYREREPARGILFQLIGFEFCESEAGKRPSLLTLSARM